MMPTQDSRAALSVALLAAGLVCFSAPRAWADPVADFYHGKNIEIDVGTGVGGGYDANARLVARHLGQFIPGNPTIIVNNVPGGGGIREANLLYNTSPRDGTAIGTFSNAMITEPLLGTGQARFAPNEFAWLGSASREDGLCAATKTSGVASWDDLLHKEIIVGTTGPGTTTYMYPLMLKTLFGAKFKLVSGYPDGGQVELALERGEVQSICQTYSSMKVGHPDWLRDHFVQPLVALSFKRLADIPDMPSVMELAKDKEQQQVLEVILAPTLAGRPFAAPPGIPPERAAALRKAFASMTQDPGFLDEAHKIHMDVDPASGSEIDGLVKQIYALPVNVVADTKRIVTAEDANK